MTTIAIGNATVVVITGSTIFLVSWLIFLLADLSRLRRMWTRLASLQPKNQTTLTRTDAVFAGLFVFTAIILLLVFFTSI
ncbi:MAG: hypothetical protein EB829_06265 [Nitrosopumilus sp. H8]|nr:MAG: hypothetical protein EB829_06265 [Nitrosopumilus sp. H8]